MWLLEKFKLHMWLTLAVCIIFLLECPGLEYKVLEEVRKVMGDEAGIVSVHESDYVEQWT